MYIDLIILCIIILSVVLGIKRGFLFEFFSMFGIFASMILTKIFSKRAYDYLELSKNDSKNMKFIIIYVVIFILIYLSLFLIIYLTKKFFEKIMLGWIDRVGGGIAGLIKGTFISFIIAGVIMIIANYNEELDKYFKESHSGKVIKEISPSIMKLFPEDMSKKVEKYRNKINLDDLLNRALKSTEQEKKKMKKIIDDRKKNSNDDKSITETLEKLFEDSKMDDKDKKKLKKEIDEKNKEVENILKDLFEEKKGEKNEVNRQIYL